MLCDFNKVCKERAFIVLEDGREVEGWFANGCRIDPKTLNEGLYWYQIRDDEDDLFAPLTIVQGSVMVDFCGTFVCDVDLELDNETDIREFGYLRE